MKIRRPRAVRVGVTYLALFLICLPAYARRAYFMGSLTYNDNAADVVAGKQPVDSLVCSNGAGGLICYKLFSCQVMISNLSTSTQNLTAYSLTLSWHFSSIAENTNLSKDDPTVRADGTINTWLARTMTRQWTGASAPPYYTLYKFQHNSPSSALGPNSPDGYIANAPFPILPGETALLIIGNQVLNAGGGIQPRQLDQANAASHAPTKTVGTCFGYIDVVDASVASPGFVVASGSIESKAGAYLNPIVLYGNRAAAAPVTTNPNYTIQNDPDPNTGQNFGIPVPGNYLYHMTNTPGNAFPVNRSVSPINQFIMPEWDSCPLKCVSGALYDPPYAETGTLSSYSPGRDWYIPQHNQPCHVTVNGGQSLTNVSELSGWPEINYNSPITINGGSPF